MSNQQLKSPISFRVMSIVAILFGILTIKSGGIVLFTDGEAHQAAGNYVPFVLWFNFLAGFVYIAAGIALWTGKSWVTALTMAIALTTLLVFAALGIHILIGGDYEVRTVMAMSLRSVVWMTIATITYFTSKRISAQFGY